MACIEGYSVKVGVKNIILCIGIMIYFFQPYYLWKFKKKYIVMYEYYFCHVTFRNTIVIDISFSIVEPYSKWLNSRIL